MPCDYGDRFGFPVHLYGFDLINTVHQALIAQVANSQGFRRCAQSHECYDFPLVHVQSKRMFAGYLRVRPFAMFIH